MHGNSLSAMMSQCTMNTRGDEEITTTMATTIGHGQTTHTHLDLDQYRWNWIIRKNIKRTDSRNRRQRALVTTVESLDILPETAEVRARQRSPVSKKRHTQQQQQLTSSYTSMTPRSNCCVLMERSMDTTLGFCSTVEHLATLSINCT